ncbi:hypothetical protein [Marinitenerispora sediminis]|uniref:Uncharacterized protein n=1 Tax=Marinitenerispora sediminis TaxID=1931232 RepID=A0A368T329_9ACTN|nr:hypothetical protein [Marinitenerispora sediminis]RCV50249.1 hypothetical protein DEF23_22375 [Marinitenerispora sediminis]RCV56312.1 hypothetical protein DEF24_16825 [Marinitenerispora sediminis]RCV56504.1 hypothetical protein DEF28_03275 [Marinitenerispora sediminis]
MVVGRRRIGPEARRRHAEDVESAARLPGLVAAAAEAERRLRAARVEGADVEELHRRGMELDAALTEAMRAAYARQRALIGARGYDDRIYRRRRMARADVREATAAAERFLTLRERHRLHGIARVPRQPAA